jgi:DNA-binding response OmpR family regulator
MLPSIDGVEVCRILRREMTIPILMVTARTDEVDRVVGLEVGADDYITKPFSMRELMARIKSQLRRIRLIHEELTTALPMPSEASLRFDDLSIDLNRCEVRLNDQVVEMKPKEYELLASLAQRRGQVLSREQLLRAVWGHTVNSRTVDVHIRWLRQKIERNPAEPKRIVTVRGLGYRFDG